jgi:apolipoprotein N-acyltransferase
MLFAFLSSILGITALLPLNLYFLGFVFLVPFFYFLYKEIKLWKLILGALIFRFFFALGTVYYTLEIFAWISHLVIFMGLPVCIFLFSRLFKDKDLVKIIYIALLYLLFDFLEARYAFLPTYIITAGNILGSSPFVALAKYGGIATLEIYVISINAIFLSIVLYRKPLFEKRSNLVMLVIFFVLLLFGTKLLSDYLLKTNSIRQAQSKNIIEVATVSLKGDFSAKILNKFENDLKNVDADLLVLPEDLFVKPENQGFRMEEASAEIAALDLKIPYIAGTFHLFKDGKNYNTTILLENNGKIIGQYDKNKLTILGEYWPFTWQPSFYNFLKKDPVIRNYAIFNPSNSYQKGEPELLNLRQFGDEISFGSLICLESHYGTMINRDRKLGAKFIISPTSNRWLAIGSSHYDYLVGNLFRIESIDSQLPMIISNINGLGGVFNPDGTMQTIGFENKNGYAISVQKIEY